MLMVLSGAMLTQALNLVGLRRAERFPAVAEAAEREGESQPGSAGHEAAPADVGVERTVPDLNGHGSGLPGGALNGAHDARIGAAAADVAVHVRDDLLARRLLVRRE